LADPQLEILRNALREHVNALSVDIGPRTPLNGDSLIRAASYIRSVFETAGFLVTEQDYQYYDQRVTNLLATAPKAAEASAYYLVGARLSDHASFWDAGLPAVMVTDTAFFRNPNYHLPSDTIDTLDFTFMAELVKSLELALHALPPASTKSQ
jgi:hypothetical protein